MPAAQVGFLLPCADACCPRVGAAIPRGTSQACLRHGFVRRGLQQYVGSAAGCRQPPRLDRRFHVCRCRSSRLCCCSLPCEKADHIYMKHQRKVRSQGAELGEFRISKSNRYDIREKLAMYAVLSRQEALGCSVTSNKSSCLRSSIVLKSVQFDTCGQTRKLTTDGALVPWCRVCPLSTDASIILLLSA